MSYTIIINNIIDNIETLDKSIIKLMLKNVVENMNMNDDAAVAKKMLTCFGTNKFSCEYRNSKYCAKQRYAYNAVTTWKTANCCNHCSPDDPDSDNIETKQTN